MQITEEEKEHLAEIFHFFQDYPEMHYKASFIAYKFHFANTFKVLPYLSHLEHSKKLISFSRGNGKKYKFNPEWPQIRARKTENMRNWLRKNKDIANYRRRERRRENPELINRKQREYRSRDRERIRIQRGEYRSRNRDKINRQKREWLARNRDRVNKQKREAHTGVMRHEKRILG